MNIQELIFSIIRSAQFTFEGRLSRDPEVRYFESGKCVARLSIPINKPGAKQGDGSEPDWFKVELWNEQAQTFADTARKGSIVRVTGRVTTEQWENNKGETVTDVVMKQVTHAEVVRSPGDSSAPARPPAAAAAPAWGAAAPGGGGFSDEEVPF